MTFYQKIKINEILYGFYCIVYVCMHGMGLFFNHTLNKSRECVGIVHIFVSVPTKPQYHVQE